MCVTRLRPRASRNTHIYVHAHVPHTSTNIHTHMCAHIFSPIHTHSHARGWGTIIAAARPNSKRAAKLSISCTGRHQMLEMASLSIVWWKVLIWPDPH